MAALEHLGDDLRSAWHSVTEGWRQLTRRAGRALARFTPGHESQWPAAGAEWGFLAADAYDEEDRIVIKLEAPGLEKEDFDLSVTDDTLLVRGEKRFEREHKNGRYEVMECAYGSFERAIPLWAEVDIDRAKASYKNGVLRVELPKTPAEQPPIAVTVE
ncbi:MAG: Hsp20/alpha crystallin family protein [Gammaproteobacteria bacterium]